MNPRLAALAAALLVTAGFLIGQALAGGAPTQSPLTWAGTVTDAAGQPLAKSVDVQVSFYDKASGGGAMCASPTVKSEAGTGRFSVVLPASCAKAVHAQAELWSETLADGKTLPRVKVGAVPFALEAQHAATAQSAVTADTAKTANAAKVADSAKVAEGATGALKTEIEGLKKGGGGSAGLSVWDANGKLVGTAVGFPTRNDVKYGEGERTLMVLSPKGYLFNVDLDTGSTVHKYPTAKWAFQFAGPNCTGETIVMPTNASLQPLKFLKNRLTYFKTYVVAGQPTRWYRLKLDGAGKPVSASVTSKYFGNQTSCNVAQTAKTRIGWRVEEVSAAAVGVSETYAMPFELKP